MIAIQMRNEMDFIDLGANAISNGTEKLLKMTNKIII